jgi:hypothetical protein
MMRAAGDSKGVRQPRAVFFVAMAATSARLDAGGKPRRIVVEVAKTGILISGR